MDDMILVDEYVVRVFKKPQPEQSEDEYSETIERLFKQPPPPVGAEAKPEAQTLVDDILDACRGKWVSGRQIAQIIQTNHSIVNITCSGMFKAGLLNKKGSKGWTYYKAASPLKMSLTARQQRVYGAILKSTQQCRTITQPEIAQQVGCDRSNVGHVIPDLIKKKMICAMPGSPRCYIAVTHEAGSHADNK